MLEKNSLAPENSITADPATAGRFFRTVPWRSLAVALLFVAILLDALATTTADPDLWGYLAFGRLFWEGHRFPYKDVFSYVPTLDPWVYHEWLTGVLFYPIYTTLGGQGLQALKYLLGLATAVLLYLTARRRGAHPVAAGLVLVLLQAFLVIGYSPVRAQVFTYFFFALTLYLLERARHTGQWTLLLALVPVQILWCNLHGGFLSGLGLVALYAAGEALSRRPFVPYLAILALSGLATLMNPYGVDYWTYLAKAVSMPRPDITEWRSFLEAFTTGVLSPVEILYLGTAVLFAVFLGAWSRWRERTALVVLCFTLYLAFSHIRHQVFFLMLLAAYLPALFTGYCKEVVSRPRWMALYRRCSAGVWAPLVVSLAALNGYQFVSREPFSLKIPGKPPADVANAFYYPVGAIDHIETHGLSGRLLTTFGWGEYALWRLYPGCKVAFDGRYETVYPEEVSRLYFRFLRGTPRSMDFLERYPPDLVLVEARSGLVGFFESDPQWEQVYADEGSVLFAHEHNGRDRAVAQKDSIQTEEGG